MKKIKCLMMAIIALIGSTTFVSCGDDDDNNNQTVSNVERYQREVDKVVRSQKKNSKAILLVAFGSTWQQAYDAFDLTKSE